MSRLNPLTLLHLLVLAAALVIVHPASARPFVVILADPRGTVATDLMAPYAILAESGAVDVKVVAETTAPVRLTPGVAWVAPQMTLEQLAHERPAGPDVIIVPALEVVEDARRSAWLRSQAARGVRIISICNGAKVLADSGLLNGRQATVHWYSQAKVAKKYPEVKWRRDLRWVVDGPITTTAGISAGEPASLQLLRDLAGEDVMRQTAARLRLPLPDQHHRGQDYHLTAASRGLVIGNLLAFWRREDVAVPLAAGIDELAFGTAIDAWSRTWRSKAWAVGPTSRTRHGLVLYAGNDQPKRLDRRAALPGPDVMRNTFEQIRLAYGPRTARFVGLQFEHPYGVNG